MGLLDSFSSPDMQLALGLLAAGGAKPVRTSLGDGLLGAVQGAQAYKQAQEDRAQKAAMQQLQSQLIGSQIEETKAQAAQRTAAAEDAKRKAMEAQRIQDLLKNTFMPTTAIQANAASGVTGPRPEALSAVGARPSVDYQSLIAQGVPPELVQKLAESRNYGRDKVARTVDGRDAQGRPVTFQQDEFGNTVGAPIQQWKAPEKVDTGGQVQFIDPVTLAQLGALGKTNTPDALLSAETARRGQNMVDARAREKNQIDKAAVGKVEWKQDVNGNWVGLPKEISGQGPVSPVTTTMPGKREQQAQNALGIIDEAAKLIDKGTSSYLGAGVDQAARVFGKATPGAEAAAQLQALEGALMMAQPRMEGPQSDKDVALYRQMAAQIGDSTVPAESKKKALQTIRSLHARYAGQQEQKPETAKTVVRTGRDASGRRVVQYSDGSIGYGD